MRSVFAVVLATLVGGLIGAALAFVNTAGFLMPWTRLPAPPQAAVRLTAAASPYLVIADGSGQLYLYQRGPGAWSQLSADQAAGYTDQAMAAPANPFMPAPPGGALAVAYVLEAGQGAAAQYGAYALGEDGSVWDWFKSYSPAEQQTGVWLAAGGAALGLAASLVLLLAQRALEQIPP